MLFSTLWFRVIGRDVSLKTLLEARVKLKVDDNVRKYQGKNEHVRWLVFAT